METQTAQIRSRESDQRHYCSSSLGYNRNSVAVNKMSDDLRDKIIADLQESGFGAELEALRIMHFAPFRTTAGHPYYDKVLSCQRQIDLLAELEEMQINNNHIYRAVLSVFAEVKKSDKPWVVLKARTYENPQTIYMDDALISEENASGHNFDLRQKIADHALTFRGTWFGHGVHEAFKKPNELGRWFKAASSVCRAACEATPPNPQANLSGLWLRHPAVILAGRLFAAETDAQLQIELQEIFRATVFYQERSGWLNRRFIVDLVTMSALPTYVSELRERLKVAHTEFMKRVFVPKTKARILPEGI